MSLPRRAPDFLPVQAKIEVTAEMIEHARKLAASGVTKRPIAARLGMSYSTFFDKLKEYPELAEAIEAGYAEAASKVEDALLTNATNPAIGKDGPTGPPGGSVEAQKLWLSRRGGKEWQEPKEANGNLPALAIQIVLPDNGRIPTIDLPPRLGEGEDGET